MHVLNTLKRCFSLILGNFSKRKEKTTENLCKNDKINHTTPNFSRNGF